MGTEIKILMALAGVLCLAELGTRWQDSHLSLDLAQIHGFEGMADSIRRSGVGDTEDRPSILVLGNSLARCGIDGGMLKQEWKARYGEEPQVLFMTPDATGVTEWAWGYRRYFLNKGSAPDFVVLVTGRTHLVDSSVMLVERMGAYYVGDEDRTTFMTGKLGSFDERISFLVARASRLWTVRDRVRPLLFYHAIPGYEETANEINSAAGKAVLVGPGEQGTRRDQCNDLDFLIASIRESGAQVIVVSIPLPGPYRLPTEVEQRLDHWGIESLLLGESSVMDEARFPDGYHLDSVGAEMTTRQLVKELAAIEEGSPGVVTPADARLN